MLKVKNKEIEIGNVLSEHKFVGGIKYWKIDSAKYDGFFYKIGTRVCWFDSDCEYNTEYCGNIEYIIVDEYGNVEVSIDNLLVAGRLDLEDLFFAN